MALSHVSYLIELIKMFVCTKIFEQTKTFFYYNSCFIVMILLAKILPSIKCATITPIAIYTLCVPLGAFQDRQSKDFKTDYILVMSAVWSN